MHYTPVIPPLPSPEGGSVSSPAPNPPVVPPFSPQNPPQTPAWMRGPQTQPGYQAAFPQGFPPGMFGQTPYLAVPTLPNQQPGSYYLAPAQLPPTGGSPAAAQTAPVGPSGFSADWTGFPITTTVPPGAPWQAVQGFPGQPPQAPPGTGFSMFQQPLPQMGAFTVPPGYVALQTPFVGGGGLPGGWPPGAFPGGGAAFAGGAAAAAAAAPPPPQPAHRMPPARGVPEGVDKFDKFAEDPACTFQIRILANTR